MRGKVKLLCLKGRFEPIQARLELSEKGNRGLSPFPGTALTD